MPNKRTEQPWDRQKGESTQAFEAFSLYLKMGADRSIRAVSQKLDKSRTLIGRWSRTYKWVERCRAWDDYLQHEAKKAAITEVRNMTRRHVTMARQIQLAAMDALKELGSNMVNPKNFAAVVRLATDLERQGLESEAEACGGSSVSENFQNNLLDILRDIPEVNTNDLPEVE